MPVRSSISTNISPPCAKQTCATLGRFVSTMLCIHRHKGSFVVLAMQFKAMIQGDAIRAVQHSVERSHSLGLAKREETGATYHRPANVTS